MSNELDLKKYIIKKIEPCAFYVSNFITEAEEQTILTNIYSAPKPKWTQLSNRRLQNWGGVPHHKGMIADTIPAWLDHYLDRIHKLDVMDNRRPNHVLVNEYLPGQGIMPHVDGSLFYPTITTISVGSHTVLKFLEQAPDTAESGGSSDAECTLSHKYSLLLEPRSLLVLKDKLFHDYLHCIEEIKEDAISDHVVNLNMCSSKYVDETLLPRATRISLTIRHVPKTTSFKLNIGNKR